MTTQTRSFAKDSIGRASASMELLFPADSDEEKLYAEAGMEALARHAPVRRRAMQVSERYEEMSAMDYKAYREFLTYYADYRNFVAELPTDIFTEIRQVIKDKLFDNVQLMADRETGEALAIGVIVEPDNTERRFAICQWAVGKHAKMHTVDQIRSIKKRQRQHETLRSEGGVLTIAGVIATAIGWGLLPWTWWAAGPFVVISMIVMAIMAFDAHEEGDIPSPLARALYLLVTFNILGILVVGLGMIFD